MTVQDWYAQAQDLAISLLQLRQWRWGSRRVSLAFSGSESPKRRRDLQRQWNSDHDARVDAIEAQVDRLSSQLRSLEEGFPEIWQGLLLAYCELGDFEHDGLPAARCGWVALQSLAERVIDWGRYLANEQQLRSLNSGESVEFQKREAWLSSAVDAIRARLMLEESRLLRDASKAQSAAKQDQEKKTSVVGRTRRFAKKPDKKAPGGDLTPAQLKMRSALEMWHGFDVDSLSCTNTVAISNRELCERAGISSTSTANKFFDEWFDGNEQYRRLCRGSGSGKDLAYAIAKMSPRGQSMLLQITKDLLEDSNSRRHDDD